MCLPILMLYYSSDFPRPLSLLAMAGLTLATVSHAGALGLPWGSVLVTVSGFWPPWASPAATVSDFWGSGRPLLRLSEAHYEQRETT